MTGALRPDKLAPCHYPDTWSRSSTMDAPVEKRQFAWQPLTGRGVAAFAGASVGRLLLVQVIVALMAAAAVVWCLRATWIPTITEAIGQLPLEGQIRAGTLDWRGPT